MKRIQVQCECCETEHYLTRAEVGRAFLKLRRTKNTTEHQQNAGALGALKRWNKTMITKEVKTQWAGRVWLHAKYLNQANNAGVPLRIVYKGEHMTIKPEDLKDVFDKKKDVDDKFKAGVVHKQYGTVFKPDKDDDGVV